MEIYFLLFVKKWNNQSILRNKKTQRNILNITFMFINILKISASFIYKSESKIR